MNVRQFNECFKQVYDKHSSNDVSLEEKVSKVLQDSVMHANAMNIMDYAPILESAIISINPDKNWWEITSCNIRNTLHETRNVDTTINRIIEGLLVEENSKVYKGYTIKFNNDGRANILDKDFNVVRNDIGSEEEGIEWIDSLTEDTVQKSNGKWTNRGDDGEEHGEFDSKKQADAQRKAMYANGYKG